MQHVRFASRVATTAWRARFWAPPLALAALGGAVLGGCPGPEPHAISSGSGGDGRTTSSGVGGVRLDGGQVGGAGGMTTTSTDNGAGGNVCSGPNLTQCPDGCFNLDTNADHCSACNSPCQMTGVDPTTRQCVGGACVITCLKGFVKPDPMKPLCVPAKRVFVSSTQLMPNFSFSGGLHGITAADALCSEAAANATLTPPGNNASWKAWLSAGTAGADAHVVGSFMGAYTLVDGTIVALTSELSTGLLRNPIDLTEANGLTDTANGVWTGTDAGGNPSGTDCTGWSSTTGVATIGDASTKTSSWTDSGQTGSCGVSRRLYCFEQ
jgi:hypothetical protein